MPAVRAQSSVEKILVKINLLAPGATVELGLSPATTIHIEGGFTMSGFSIGSYYNDVDAQLFASGSWRKYYNLSAREAKGKNTAGNSGNYFGVRAIYYGKDVDDENEDDSNIFFPAAVWGFQRTYKSGWNMGIELGLGYQFEKYDDSIAPVLSFRLGYRIR